MKQNKLNNEDKTIDFEYEVSEDNPDSDYYDPRSWGY